MCAVYVYSYVHMCTVYVYSIRTYVCCICVQYTYICVLCMCTVYIHMCAVYCVLILRISFFFHGVFVCVQRMSIILHLNILALSLIWPSYEAQPLYYSMLRVIP